MFLCHCKLTKNLSHRHTIMIFADSVGTYFFVSPPFCRHLHNKFGEGASLGAQVQVHRHVTLCQRTLVVSKSNVN